MSDDIVDCTPDQPWNGKRQPGQRVRHQRVTECGDQRDGWPGGDIVTYRCLDCGATWNEELPQ